MIFNFLKNKEKGFTLMEALVAITILTIGIAASVGAIISSINLSKKTENKTVAAYLALEGLEIVKNIRDVNWINGDSFDNGIVDGWGCVQYNTSSIDYNCSNSLNSSVIVFDGNYYSHDVGSETIYSRTITTTLVSPSGIKVDSLVTCGGSCQVSMSTYLFDWK